jgi:very-short-patch-repair endonuclease
MPGQEVGTDEGEVRDRAIRLFTFLKELTELRSKTVRSCDQYEKVLWFRVIPRNLGCHCIAWKAVPDEEASDVWVEIRQPKSLKPPQLPSRLKSWVDHQELENSDLTSPSLRDRIVIPRENPTGDDVPETEVVELASEPELKHLFERYVEEKWTPWATEDRKLREVQEVYSDLFAIYQKQQRLGEAYEVVLGLGCLAWKLPSDLEVKRHLITCQVSLAFDAERGIISLGPAADGPAPVLEQDMLEPQERPDAAEQTAIEAQIKAIGDSIWDGVHVPTALKSWVRAVSPNGEFEETLDPPSSYPANPVLTLGPALILRRRTDQRFIKVYKEIIDQLKAGNEIPIGVSRLVSIVDDREFRPSDEEYSDSDTPSMQQPEEVYFPLPSNAEQQRIVGALSSRQGVLVQGPPGTGKSHTITNLVCHLLAVGKRVLITSHTPRALRVLLDKFYKEEHLKEIASLCVILLGDDLDSRKALEDSVQGILDHLNHWDERQSKKSIQKAETELNDRRKEIALILQELRAIREKETYKHESLFGSYSGTAQDIARRIRREKEQYAWLPATPELDQSPPLSDAEGLELLRLLRNISPEEEVDLRKTLLSRSDLLTPSEFKLLLSEEAEHRTLHETLEGKRRHPAYPCFTRLSSESRQGVLQQIANLVAAFEELSRHIHAWASKATEQILGDRDRMWRGLLTATKKRLERIGLQQQHLRATKVTGCDNRDLAELRNHAADLHAHLSDGGSLGVWIFQHKVVRKCRFVIEEIKVDGQRCDNVQALDALIRWTDIMEKLTELRDEWSPHATPPTGSIHAQIAEYHDMCEPIEAGLQLLEQVLVIKEELKRTAGFHQPSWHKIDEVREFMEVGHAVKVTELLGAVRVKLSTLEDYVAGHASNTSAHGTTKDLLAAIRTRDGNGYDTAHRTIIDIEKRKNASDRRYFLLNALRSTSPLLAKDLASHFSDPVWDDRLSSFSAAWNWARANRWIDQLSDSSTYRKLTYSMDANRKRNEELLGSLASQKAWGFCISRIQESQRQHLVAWRKAVERIGKGKGKAKFVAKNREEARTHMQECRSTIPAWIMPIYRVAESFAPGKDAFDVVIVDEASQSGPEALFLQYLAKQIIVVGDDKQISPDNVGLNKDDVNLLRERNINDLPHNDSLGIEHSFFDQAELRYGGRIRLREHFRCMPEIIQFSNNLCYASQPLIPLRQFGSGRLTPVIIARHVPGAYQQGHSPRVDNPVEAEAIAQQIKECCENPAYDGKTMGVISLLGENQARLIERHLFKLIGPSEMKKRDLICGDAYAFQGDERDIIFLSLVSAPKEGARISTLASPKDEKRFNVATSRARDQMWLFHSATLNDLSPQCLRHRLLSYFLLPHVRTTVPGGASIEDLCAASRNADRSRERPPSPFDSWFEIDVFLKIVNRGYRVIPQFEVAGYYIDLVVQGMKGRLAVECDGDEVHGLDQFDEDMARQRMLERCGWNFWRIRASSFYRDEEAALQDLWTLLKQKGINPTAEDTNDSTANESRTKSQSPSADFKTDKTIAIVNVDQNDESVVEDSTWLRGDQPVIQDNLFSSSQASAVNGFEPLGEGLISQASCWFKLSHWRKSSGQQSSYLNRFAYDMGRRLSRQAAFTEKQIALAQKTWNDALRNGFDPSDTSPGT